MSNQENYKYPTREEIAADVRMESAAITVAMARLADALEDCPLKDHFKVYALIELAFKYGPRDYVQEVFDEVVLFVKPSK